MRLQLSMIWLLHELNFYMYKVEVFMAEIGNKPEKSFIPRELIVHYLDQSIDFTKKSCIQKRTQWNRTITSMIQHKCLSLIPKSEKRKNWLLTTLKHFGKGLQSYLGSWCKSLFAQYSADSDLQKTPVDSVYVRHLESPEQFPRVTCEL